MSIQQLKLFVFSSLSHHKLELEGFTSLYVSLEIIVIYLT